MDRECASCGTGFVAKRSTAKYCSATCRKRANRGTPPPEPKPEEPAPVVDEDAHGLVGSVRAELERAGRTGTFSGQLALQLARRLSNPDESGISSLSKELRTVMAAALDGVTPPPAEDGTVGEPVEEEDEVTRARRQREEARQAAGLA